MSADVPLVKSVMTPFPWSIDVGKTVGDAQLEMETHGVGHLPVLERSEGDAEVVGILCGRELRGLDAGSPLREVMLTPAYVVDMEEPVESIATVLAEEKADCVVVVKDERVAGIFTRTDACSLLARFLREHRETGGDDAA